MAFGDRLAQRVAKKVAADPYTKLGGMVQQGRDAGYFDPMGSPRLRALLRARALRSGRNRRRRAAVLANSLNLSPEQAAYSSAQADANASADTADFLNDAELSQVQGNQDYFRGLFGEQLGIGERRREAEMARRQAEKDRRGGFIGSAVGLGTKYLTGGIG